MDFSEEVLSKIKYKMCDFDFILSIRAPDQSFENYIEKLKNNGKLKSVLNYSIKPAIENFNSNNSSSFPSKTSSIIESYPKSYLYNGQQNPNSNHIEELLLQKKSDKNYSPITSNIANAYLSKDIDVGHRTSSKEMLATKDLLLNVETVKTYADQTINKPIVDLNSLEKNSGEESQKNTDDAISKLLNLRRNANLRNEQHGNTNQIGQNLNKDSNPISNNTNIMSQVASFNAQQISKAKSNQSSLYTNTSLTQQMIQYPSLNQSSRTIYNEAQNYQYPLYMPQQNNLQQYYNQQQQQIYSNQLNIQNIQGISQQSSNNLQNTYTSFKAYPNFSIQQSINENINDVQKNMTQNRINDIQKNLQHLNIINIQQQRNATSYQQPLVNNQQQNGFGFQLPQQQSSLIETNTSILTKNTSGVPSGTKMLAKYSYEKNVNSPFGADGELSLKVMDEVIFIGNQPEISEWALVKNKEDKVGYVPFNYLTIAPVSTNLPWLQNKAQEVQLPPVQTKVIKPYISAYDTSTKTQYRCDICNKSFNGVQPYNSHMVSKSHKEEVEIQESYRK